MSIGYCATATTVSKSMKLELENWSEAEIELINAREIASMLSQSLYTDGHKQDSDVAYAIARNIDSALSWIESGLIRGD